MKSEINITELMSFIRKKLIVILAGTILGLSVSAVYTLYFAVPMFESTTQLLVDQRRSDDTALNTGDINANIQLIETYKELITGPAILGIVKERLNTDLSVSDLAKKIEVEAPNNVQVFNITVSDSDPYQATELTNTVADVFNEEIQIIMPRIDNVAVIYEGTPSLSPVSPNMTLNLVRGFAFGFLMSAGVAVIQYLLDGKLRTNTFITEEIGWNDLGTIYEVSERSIHYYEEEGKKSKSFSKTNESAVNKI